MPERTQANRRAQSLGARVFLAIDLPAATKDLVGIELRTLRELAGEYNLKLTWTREDALHLTLAFVASADPSGIEDIGSAMASIANSTRQFNLGLGGGGAFPNLREPSTLWLGVARGSESLAALARATQEAVTSIGYPQAPRPYKPHLTIARSRRIQDVGAIVAAATTISLPAFAASEVVLFRSHLDSGPPRYERLAGFALALGHQGEERQNLDEK